MATYQKGDAVQWPWGGGYGMGTVTERHTTSITRTLKGSDITRNGSDDDAALVIKQDDGDTVLKLESEVDKVRGEP